MSRSDRQEKEQKGAKTERERENNSRKDQQGREEACNDGMDSREGQGESLEL